MPDQERERLSHRVLSNAAGLVAAAAALTLTVVMAPYLSNFLTQTFYQVEFGAPTPVWRMQWWEPPIALFVMILYLLVSTVVIVAVWRLSQITVEEVLA